MLVLIPLCCVFPIAPIWKFYALLHLTVYGNKSRFTIDSSVSVFLVLSLPPTPLAREVRGIEISQTRTAKKEK